MKKPVVLVVMDGVGETPEELGNMVKKATTPTLNELKETCPWQIIKAHGTAVGLPSDDDMGTPKSATTRSAAVRFTRRAPSSSTNPSNPARFTPRMRGRTSSAT